MNNNPFAKTDSLTIGKETRWKIDHQAVHATKSAVDMKGNYYHLLLDNNQLKLFLSQDAKGLKPKEFNQLEVKDVRIDGKQNQTFNWCLNNQQRHDRFLQQGLEVKNNICSVNGKAGSFVMQLNQETLLSLQQGTELLIILKPFRTPVELHYDISDFKDIYIALNTKPEPVAKRSKKTEKAARKECHLDPPTQYNSIRPVKYDCDNAAEKKDAKARLNKLVDKEKAKQEKIAAEKEKQRKLAEQKKQKELAEKRKRQELLRAEAAAIAASEAKQAEISDEIAQKMIKVCDKYWSKGEHRCYCQKYIEHAPADVQAKSTCK